MPASAPSARATKPRELAHAELSMLLERYQVLGVIGQGGMGTVFKGYHVNLKRHVAIKTLRIDKITTPDSVSRFRQEMELVGQMDHPNVVRATDAGEKNGVFYLVMEFLPGCDLGTLVNRNGPLDLPNACELIRQAALGLHYIHQTLVHRDIKPSNLMLTTGGLVKILDLGLARCDLATLSEREETPFGYAVGTFSYMAPEQAGGGRCIDGRADIYSLGCTLFKLLTGKTPFSGPAYDNAAKQLNAHCNVPLTSVDEFHALPEKVKPVLLRMTAKDPDERYATAQEVADALAAFVGSSQPARLLEEATEPPVAPVPTPAPAELTRLTESFAETPQETATGSSASLGPPRRGRRIRWVLAASFLLVAIGALAFFLTRPEAGLRNLDRLKKDTAHPLLDRKPVPVGCDLDDPAKYHWDDGLQRLQVHGAHNGVFLLGTTTRARFIFETTLEQSPWTGEIGICWGYNEDAELKAARSRIKEFARFQYLRIHHYTNPDQQRVYWVQRGIGKLIFNASDEVAPLLTGRRKHDVKLAGGSVSLRIEIHDNRLHFARLGEFVLRDLFSETAQEALKNESCHGGLGVFTLQSAAGFSDARFVAGSNK